LGLLFLQLQLPFQPGLPVTPVSPVLLTALPVQFLQNTTDTWLVLALSTLQTVVLSTNLLIQFIDEILVNLIPVLEDIIYLLQLIFQPLLLPFLDLLQFLL
jgi:hypothetical protein